MKFNVHTYLGLSPDALPAVIKSAHRRWLLTNHPDTIQKLPNHERAVIEEVARMLNRWLDSGYRGSPPEYDKFRAEIEKLQEYSVRMKAEEAMRAQRGSGVQIVTLASAVFVISQNKVVPSRPDIEAAFAVYNKKLGYPLNPIATI